MKSRELHPPPPRRAGGRATALEQQVQLAAPDSDIAGRMAVPHLNVCVRVVGYCKVVYKSDWQS